MRAALILASAVALAGCGGGGITIMDGGPGTDAGSTPTDTGVRTDAGGGGGTDAGTCPPVMAPAPAGNVCANSTLVCLMAATTAAAQQACITADPMAMACNTCINSEVASSCTSGTGTCADEFGLVRCCLQDACPTGDQACVGTATSAGGTCETQVTTMIACFNADQMARRCTVSALCFMPAAGFAPDFRHHELPAFDVSNVLWSGVFAD